MIGHYHIIMHSPLTVVKKANFISFIGGDFPRAQDIHEEIMHTLINLHKIFPQWVICTCRSQHPGFFYLSDNYYKLLGLDSGIVSDPQLINKYLESLHPADLEHVTKCYQLMGNVLSKESASDHHKFRIIFNYRIRNAGGKYLNLHDERAALLLKGDANLYYRLLRAISEESVFSGVKMVIYKGDDDEKILEYNANSLVGSQLSKRESELLPLMRQGLLTKEIAVQLCISPNTVRNMRQKLFEKFQVNNAIELLNKVEVIPMKEKEL